MNKPYPNFLELYNNNRLKILNYITNRVNSREDAEDITEEVFIKIYKNLADFKWQGVAIESWIYKIAKNAIIDYHRKYSKEKAHVDIDSIDQSLASKEKDLLLSLLDDEEVIKLYNALSNLKPTDQYIIYYKYFEELTLEEIAIRMKLSENNIGIKLHRLRKKILEILDNEHNSQLKKQLT